jgi:hypothetical protein
LQEARTAASAAIDNLALEQHLAPVRKGARVIREISWRWREIGADSRICDLIDSQVNAIEASCGQLATADPHRELRAAFALIGRQIAAFDDSEDAPLQAAIEAAALSPAPAAERPVAPVEQVEASSGEAETASAQPMPAEQTVATVEAADVTAEAEAVADTEPVMSAEVGEITEASGMSDEAADAHDDAVLDLIAAEMSAPDVSDTNGYPDELETPQAEPPAAPERIAPVEEVAVAPETAPAIEPSAPEALQGAPGRPVERTPEPSPQPEPEPSIGSTLLAGGLLRGHGVSDPLAALRRLSQAEKIALFS